MRPHYRDPLPLGDPAGLPYSKGLMARSLVHAGVGIESAYVLATRIELDLVLKGSRVAEVERLEELAAELLGEQEGQRVVSRLRRLAALQALDLPIVLLVGGATGTGKSSVATDVAHRLGITRVTSTDFIRQTIRAYFPPEELPAVHASSFEARRPETGTEAGFLEQTGQVLVGVEAAIGRALTEGWSMVIEGVHLVPGMVPSSIDGTLLVHAVLEVESIEIHRGRFHVRDASTGGVRPMERYLDQIEEIRLVQRSIVERAREHGVEVIESSDTDRAAAVLLDLVLAATERLGVLA